MALKIGELARRTGLTVRALRHYDAIGLLSPSERTDAGHRLYGTGDVARLYRIQALRRMDLSLAEIDTMLDDASSGIGAVLSRQLAQLEGEIERATAMRQHLLGMQQQLAAHGEPDLADCLVALERMVLGPRYFSADDERVLQTRRTSLGAPDRAEQGRLQSALQELLAAGTPPHSAAAQALAQRWIALLLQEVGGDEGLLMKVYLMHWHERSLHALTGVDRSGMRYLSEAMAFARVQRHAPHCTADEMQTLRTHYAAQAAEWPPLISEVRQQMDAGAPADGAPMRALGRRWQALSLAKAGGDRALHDKLERALSRDAGLRTGSGIDAPLAAYVARAIAALAPSPH